MICLGMQDNCVVQRKEKVSSAFANSERKYAEAMLRRGVLDGVQEACAGAAICPEGDDGGVQEEAAFEVDR